MTSRHCGRSRTLPFDLAGRAGQVGTSGPLAGLKRPVATAVGAEGGVLGALSASSLVVEAALQVGEAGENLGGDLVSYEETAATAEGEGKGVQGAVPRSSFAAVEAASEGTVMQHINAASCQQGSAEGLRTSSAGCPGLQRIDHRVPSWAALVSLVL